MKELDFLDIINKTLKDTSLLGDDCALVEENLYITQDTLVENVHFDLKTITPRQLGYKAIAVNLSDLAAALAIPKYISIGFSCPNYIDKMFVEEFYLGINEICEKYNVKVIGGDITGANSLFISITAIGKKISKYDISRSFASVNDVICVVGNHGSSSCGFFLLNQKDFNYPQITKEHLTPEPKLVVSSQICSCMTRNIATMDTSDGLADALFKVAVSSNKTLEVDFSSIPFDPKIVEVAIKYNKNYEDWILWGGEDYGLLICMPEEMFTQIDNNSLIKIGKVKEKSQTPVIIRNSESYSKIDLQVFNSKSYNHFEN